MEVERPVADDVVVLEVLCIHDLVLEGPSKVFNVWFEEATWLSVAGFEADKCGRKGFDGIAGGTGGMDTTRAPREAPC